MNRKIIFISGLILLQTAGLSGQVIMSQDDRTNILNGMEGVLENVSRPGTTIGENESPFYVAKDKPKDQAVVQTATREDEVDTEVVAQTVILKDDVALGIIARQFKPLGSMVLGDRGYLQLPGGRTVEKGQKFNAEIRGHTYEVLIRDITENGYTLELGTAHSDFSFIKASAAQ